VAIDLIRRELPDGDSEFATLMWFESLDSIRAFMGEDYAKSHVPAAARAVLASFEECADHYEVLDRRPQPSRRASFSGVRGPPLQADIFFAP
jgi:hypothetical protein